MYLKYNDPTLEKIDQAWMNYSLYRYAEVLLIYAEALNEAEPGNPDILIYANKTRERKDVNMPPIGNGSQAEIRERIRNERRVELAFEDHRLWDTRRWMTATTELNSPLEGVKIVKNDADGTFAYEKVTVENRVFSPKMYFYPIPGSVILNEQVIAAGWPQNPIWE